MSVIALISAGWVVLTAATVDLPTPLPEGASAARLAIPVVQTGPAPGRSAPPAIRTPRTPSRYGWSAAMRRRSLAPSPNTGRDRRRWNPPSSYGATPMPEPRLAAEPARPRITPRPPLWTPETAIAPHYVARLT